MKKEVYFYLYDPYWADRRASGSIKGQIICLGPYSSIVTYKHEIRLCVPRERGVWIPSHYLKVPFPGEIYYHDRLWRLSAIYPDPYARSHRKYSKNKAKLPDWLEVMEEL